MLRGMTTFADITRPSVRRPIIDPSAPAYRTTPQRRAIRVIPLRTRLAGFALALTTALLAGCGASGPVLERSRESDRHAHRGQTRPATVDGERLIERRAVGRFYGARASKPAWDRHDLDEIVEAIRGVAQDGLDPKDYHLGAIEALAKEPERTAETQPISTCC
jgi:hypothetical protein